MPDLGGPTRLFILYTAGSPLDRYISHSQGLYLHTGKHRQTSMPRMGFELMTPQFEIAKTMP
jgi:hypothetical protein